MNVFLHLSGVDISGLLWWKSRMGWFGEHSDCLFYVSWRRCGTPHPHLTLHLYSAHLHHWVSFMHKHTFEFVCPKWKSSSLLRDGQPSHRLYSVCICVFSAVILIESSCRQSIAHTCHLCCKEPWVIIPSGVLLGRFISLLAHWSKSMSRSALNGWWIICVFFSVCVCSSWCVSVCFRWRLSSL